MDKITRFAVGNTQFSILMLLFIFFFGIFTYKTMPSQEDPEITIRDAQVTAIYPGLSIRMTEELIAKPIERKIREMPEVEDIKTTIQPGYVLVQPKLYDRYFDLDPIWQDLRNKMNDVKPMLPKGTQGPIVNDDYGDVASATVALHGKGFTLAELDELARGIKDRLGSVVGVSKVELYGIQQERFFIDINMDRLAHLNMESGDIVTALQAQNVILPGGYIDADGSSIGVDPSGNFTSIDQIRQLQISVPKSGQVIYLADIASVSRGYQDPPVRPAYYNNEPAIIVAISMTQNFNIIAFGTIVEEALAKERAHLPEGVQFDVVTWQPAFVKASVEDATSNLLQTVIVVLIVVVAFLGFRTGLIVGAIVPLAMCLTVVVMHLMGVQLHRMSIAAIIIALGLLVDNGVVMAEDISSRMAAGAKKKDAAFAAAKSLGVPLLTSSFTTILAFLPLILADNVTGEFLRALGIVISIALLGSWFLCMYATPAISVWTLKEYVTGQPQEKTSGVIARLNAGYRALLPRILAMRYLFLLVMVGLFVLSIFLMKLVPQQIMPPSSRNQYLVYVDLPAGTDIRQTIANSNTLSRWLNDRSINPEITNHVSYVGFGGPRFFLALSPVDPSDNTIFMVVNTKTAEDVPELMARTNDFIRTEMPDATGVSKQMSLSQDEVGLAEYRISGPDDAVLWELAERYTDAMRETPGSVGIRNNWQNPALRIAVNIDQARARRAGVTSESIARTLGTYFESTSISDYREGDKVIPIVVRGDEGRNNMDTLRSLSVISQSGVPVPLIQVARFSATAEPSRIMRFNQERTMTVEGRVPGMTALAFDAVLQEKLSDLVVPDGYRVELGGEIEGGKKANTALFKFMPLALALMFILLVWQFKSITRTAIIFLTIPLCLIGAVIGLLATGALLDFNGMLGLFSLAGIIVNNGIVLIDRMDSERQQTDNLTEAVVNACAARLRPILMTTLTTIIGLVPMAVFGEELWFAMSVVIMFGLAAGTVLTLGFVPVLYMMLLGRQKPVFAPAEA
jgi:multidrug efflux pump subunit AcrB